MINKVIASLEAMKETQDKIASLEKILQQKKDTLTQQIGQYEKAFELFMSESTGVEMDYVKEETKQKKIRLTQDNISEVQENNYVYVKDCDVSKFNGGVHKVAQVNVGDIYPLYLIHKDTMDWITLDEVYLVDEDFDPELD